MNRELNELNFEFLDSRPEKFNSNIQAIFSFIQIIHEYFFVFILLKIAT
jgi:hypothetical protein